MRLFRITPFETAPCPEEPRGRRLEGGPPQGEVSL
jgi:hypothetical protein